MSASRSFAAPYQGKDLPYVTCIMLANGRPEMVARAVRCFHEQTYERKRLVIWNTGKDQLWKEYINPRVWVPQAATEAFAGASVGVLRNAANKYALDYFVGVLRNAADKYALDYYTSTTVEPWPAAPAGLVAPWAWPRIIAHWDSDDWSHPLRLEEQVMHLQASGAPCVGYNKMLFWDSRKYVAKLQHPRELEIVDSQWVGGESVEGFVNEAWLYSNGNRAQPLGTSLMYWRETWENNNFQDMHPATGGEDVRFLDTMRPRPCAVPSLCAGKAPRMIAAIHGANTSTSIVECKEWIRVPEYDEICRKTMTL